MWKTKAKKLASVIAGENGLRYGRSVFDGSWYVGTEAELAKVGVVQPQPQGVSADRRRSASRPHAPRRHGNMDDDFENEGEPEDDFDLKGEMEDALIIGDTRGRGYSLALSGRHLGTFPSFDAALRFGAQKMADQEFWPNVFYVNERGNTDLLSVKTKVVKGKVIKATSSIVRSWV